MRQGDGPGARERHSVEPPAWPFRSSGEVGILPSAVEKPVTFHPTEGPVQGAVGQEPPSALAVSDLRGQQVAMKVLDAAPLEIEPGVKDGHLDLQRPS